MMESKIAVSAVDERRLIDVFLENPELRRQRIFFNRALSNPVWWLGTSPDGGRRKPALHPNCVSVWPDPRFEALRRRCIASVLDRAALRGGDPAPFQCRCRRHGLTAYVIPLVVNGKRIGLLGMSHLRPSALRRAPLELLNSMVRTLLSNALKELELRRLSESVRPRAIALSTVHTVHRIINSTLNLDELTQRLANLTAQVLRARFCAIYLQTQGRGIRSISEKARSSPASAGDAVRHGPVRVGGLEKRVYRTAKYHLGKNTLCVPLIDEDVIGVITVTHKKDSAKFDSFDLEILTTLAEEAVIAIKNAQLYEEQKKVTLETIQALAAVLGTRFASTRKLPSKVFIRIALAIAERLGLSEEEKQALHYAALLKDAGKIALPDDILKKPAKLTGEEYRLIRQHPIKGAMIVRSFESLKPVAPIVLYSHENFDGSGYPHGLKGGAIPMGARILAVMNAFDALIAGRPYRTRATLNEAIEELRRHGGTQFDPKVVDALVLTLERPSTAKLIAEVQPR